VQALFHHGLLVGAGWARTLAAAPSTDLDGRQLGALAERWENAAALLRKSFGEHFWDEKNGYLFDHLNRDGSPDRQIRPNAILALWVSLDRRDFKPLLESVAGRGEVYKTPLIEFEQEKAIMRTATQTIMLPHGVASLSPKDPQFHERHLALDRYFFDEAYHNGDVWEWLTGPAVSCLLDTGEKEKAWKLVEPLVDEILYRSCVGSLREIRDGVDTPGKTEFGGATSQAWSLAEFLRVCLTEFVSFEGRPSASSKAARCRYMGIHGWISAKAIVDPSRIPMEWNEIRFRFPFVCASPVEKGPEKSELFIREGVVRPARRPAGSDTP
jgi:4-alpha-glucanotransferase